MPKTSRNSRSIERASLALGTVVRLQVVTAKPKHVVEQAMDEAMQIMRAVEDACSRFDASSELMRLVTSPVGQAMKVGNMLYQALRFAHEVAVWTDGRFDPTVGARLQSLGFRQHYLTGQSSPPTMSEDDASFRDIELDDEAQTITLHKPLSLDLGAVAKGLAIDLASKALSQFDFEGYVVDAGGDVYLAGTNQSGEPWTVNVRHPAEHDEAILSLALTDVAVCTSGTYERKSPIEAGAHHIVDAISQQSANGFLSSTAIGPYAMMADAFSTAAFLYPPEKALQLLEGVGLEGAMVTNDLQVLMTSRMEGYLK